MGASLPAQAATDSSSLSASYTASTTSIAPGNFTSLSQGGQSELTNPNYLNNALQKLGRSGATYFRIDHITDDAYYHLVNGSPGSLTYDFSLLDPVIASVYNAGMTPWVSLDFSPSALTNLPFDDPSSVSGNYTDWQSTVTAIVSHYASQGHTGLHWEVWNEPDGVPHGYYYNSGSSQFFQLYAATANAVKAGDSTALVGGPAISHGPASDSDPFLGAFLDAIQASGAPFDFYSWHNYGSDNIFNATSTVKASLQARSMWPKQLWVSEWDSCAGVGTAAGQCSDTNANSSFATKQLLDGLKSPDLTGALYYSPEDPASMNSSAALFVGDDGMTTSNLHAKATLNAIQQVGSLKSQRVAETVSGSTSGRGGLVSKDGSSSTVSVVLYNYNGNATNMSISLSNLPYLGAGTNYKVVTTVIDQTHDNFYNLYQAGVRGCTLCAGESSDPSRTDILASASSFSRTDLLQPYSVESLTFTPTSGAVGAIASTETMPVWNIAADGAVTGNSSGSNTSNGWDASFVTDGYENSVTGVKNGWVSALGSSATSSQNLTIDLGSSKPVDSVRLWPVDSPEVNGGWFPVDFTIQGATSSSGPWTTLSTQTNYNSAAPVHGPQDFGFTEGTYRYLRVAATKLTKISSYLTNDDQASGGSAGAFSYAGSGWGSCTNYCSDPQTYADMYLGSNTYSSSTGDYALYSFIGTAAKLFANVGPDRGISNVQVCNASGTSCGSATPVDQYAASYKSHVPVFGVGSLSNAAHTLKITVSGTRNASSSDNYAVIDSGAYLSTQYGFGLSEFEAFGPSASGQTNYDDTSAAFTYSGSSWGNCGSGCGGYQGLFNGTNSYGDASGDYALVHFTGSRVRLFGVLNTDRGQASVAVCNASGASCGSSTTVDFYGDLFEPNVPVFDSGVITTGAHTLKVTILGSHRTGGSANFAVLDRALVFN